MKSSIFILNCLNVNMKPEITRKATTSVKLELAKQGFCFSGGVLYNDLPIEIRDTDGYGKFKELAKAHFS